MADLLGQSCTMVKGQATTLKERLELWSTPGMDGVGVQKLGKHDGVFQFEVVMYGTGYDVDLWFAAIEDKQGKIGDIVDDWGVTNQNCLIERVGPRDKKAAKLPGNPLECIGRLEISGRKLKN
jgi:hypothetical protein